MGHDTVTGRATRGHTLIELLLALFILALLAGLVAPIVTGGVHRAKESALKEDLYRMRKAIDDYYADTGAYPPELEELVRKRYLRSVPADPLTESRESWRLAWSEEADDAPRGIIDLHSGSDAVDGDGIAYAEW
jgi:general secretion pathway protein G